MPTIAHQLERAIEEGNKQAERIAALEDEVKLLRKLIEVSGEVANRLAEELKPAEAERDRLLRIESAAKASIIITESWKGLYAVAAASDIIKNIRAILQAALAAKGE